jgi:hypothetical protein
LPERYDRCARAIHNEYFISAFLKRFERKIMTRRGIATRRLFELAATLTNAFDRCQSIRVSTGDREFFRPPRGQAPPAPIALAEQMHGQRFILCRALLARQKKTAHVISTWAVSMIGCQ